MKRYTILFALLISAQILLIGCSAGRITANRHVRDMDFTWVKPGQTTRDQIIDKMGLPPPFGSENLTELAYTSNALHYLAFDVHERAISLDYYFAVNFDWGWEDATDDIYIWLDDKDIVQRISHVQRRDDKVKLMLFKETPKKATL